MHNRQDLMAKNFAKSRRLLKFSYTIYTAQPLNAYIFFQSRTTAWMLLASWWQCLLTYIWSGIVNTWYRLKSAGIWWFILVQTVRRTVHPNISLIFFDIWTTAILRAKLKYINFLAECKWRTAFCLMPHMYITYMFKLGSAVNLCCWSLVLPITILMKITLYTVHRVNVCSYIWLNCEYLVDI